MRWIVCPTDTPAPGPSAHHLPSPSCAGGASRAYILRSTLPAELLPLLAVPQPLAAARPFVGGAAGTDRPEDSGAILDLAQDTGGGVGGPACTGLVWTILGLILVNDRSMTDGA